MVFFLGKIWGVCANKEKTRFMYLVQGNSLNEAEQHLNIVRLCFGFIVLLPYCFIYFESILARRRQQKSATIPFKVILIPCWLFAPIWVKILQLTQREKYRFDIGFRSTLLPLLFKVHRNISPCISDFELYRSRFKWNIWQTYSTLTFDIIPHGIRVELALSW